MTYYDHGEVSGSGFFEEEVPDLALGDEVEHGADFVCQEDFSSLAEGSGEAEALHFTAG